MCQHQRYYYAIINAIEVNYYATLLEGEKNLQKPEYIV